MNLPRWSHAGVNGNEDDMDSTAGELNGRIMKRYGSLKTPGEHWEAESKNSSLSPTDLLDTSKICLEFATTSTNESDELDLATSECSESDMIWQTHVQLPKVNTTISNGLVSRSPRKSAHLRQGKNLETRYLYHRCCMSCFLCYSQGHIILLSN